MFRAVAFFSSLLLLAAVAFATTAAADRTAPTAVAGARRRPASPTTIRLDGIGPLRLGMTRRAATATGWLRSSSETCNDRAGALPQVMRADGPRAAPAVNLSAYFRSGANGKLTHLMFSGGARTELGIRPGVSTAAQMIARYRRAGFAVRSSYSRDYGGTFVEARRHGKLVMTGLAPGRVGARRALTIVAIPSFFRC